METVEQQNLARSRFHEVTPIYSLLADDKQPIAGINVQISSNPPGEKTFQIVQASGHSWGKKIVRDLLKQETAPTRDGHSQDIDRMNYDLFLLREQFDVIPEYVWHIALSARKEVYYLDRSG